jgi:hypothetical protein
VPRIRTIKPEFWVDEKVVELDPWARLLFIGLWNFADDQGFIEYSPKRIKMQIFPGDTTDVAPLLASLIEAGLLAAYESPIGRVLHIQSWSRHQKVSNPSSPRFDIADLEQISRTADPAPEPSRAFESPLSGKERKGKEEERKGTYTRSLAVVPDPVVPDPEPVADAPVRASKPTRTKREIDEAFARFWEVYPRREAKQAAVKAWAKLAKDPAIDLEAVVAGAERFRDDGARQRAELRFTAHPASWLNAHRWLDERPANGTSTRAAANLVERDGLMLGPANVAAADRRQRMAALQAQRDAEQLPAIEGSTR